MVADELGSARGEVGVAHGDTEAIAYGVVRYASRNAVVAGNAAFVAARQVKDKALMLAGQVLEAGPDDLEFRDGGVQVRRVPGRRGSLRQLASASSPGQPLPDGMQPRPEATHYFL